MVGPPIDPAYTRFLEGLRQIISDPAGKAAWRWYAREGKWFDYPMSAWVIEDLGLPDTPSENALHEEWGYPQSTWKLQELFVDQLFSRVQKAYSVLESLHPQSNLVWSPWGGGEWRNAFRRTEMPPPPPPNGKPIPGHLTEECLRQIEKTRDQERRGLMTHDQANKIIGTIVADCTS